MSADTKAAPPESGMELELVFCRAAEHGFGMEASAIRSARRESSLAAPTVAPRLENLLGLPASAQDSRLCLCMRGRSTDWWLSVRGPLLIRRLSVRQIFPLPRLLAAHPPLPGLCAFARQDEDWWMLLDATRLEPKASPA